jgi:Zn finger protein HypA/HybF involved in hydrogenase expression
MSFRRFTAFKCDGCGLVIEFPGMNDIKKARKEMEKKGWTLKAKKYDMCPDCNKAMTKLKEEEKLPTRSVEPLIPR